MKLLFATNNRHKLREVREILGDIVSILSLSDISFEAEIPETQETIEGNAMQKARFIYEQTGMDCFADDTGLFINALDGRPGVYSARYAGENCSFHDNVVKVLEELGNNPNRNASFHCAVCLILDNKEHFFHGKVDGRIILNERGSEGFGYDPVFLPDGFDQTFADLPPETKNEISHRGMAIREMLTFLDNR
jgi:XTP/dITP diphosphohydrolase